MKIRLFPKPPIETAEEIVEHEKTNRRKYTIIGTIVLAFIGYRILDRHTKRTKKETIYVTNG